MGFLCYMFSYDLEFTVAQNLVAVSNGTLLYQVGYLIFLYMSVVIMTLPLEDVHIFVINLLMFQNKNFI